MSCYVMLELQAGCDGPTERISAFLDRLLQPIAQRQACYLKDSTDFINFIESTDNLHMLWSIYIFGLNFILF